MHDDADFKVYAGAIEEMKLAVLADRVITDADLVQVADLSLEATPDTNTTWVNAVWTGAPGTSRICTVLVAGREVPTAEVPDGAMKVTRRGRRRVWLFLPNSPEKLIRPSEGFLRVY